MALDFPSNPTDGQIYDRFYWSASDLRWKSNSTAIQLIPTGVITQYGGSVAPSGYLFCTGQSLATSTYSELFAVVGYKYGGSGSNFNLPDLRNRVVVGKGDEVEFDPLGKTGGSKTHTLDLTQLPVHTHIQDAHNHTQNAHNHNQDPHSHTYYFGYGNVNYGSQFTAMIPLGWNGSYTTSATAATNQATTATNIAATATNQNTGGGLAHNNLQPYIVLNYIIKT